MLHGTVIIITSFAYLGLLFAIAYYADKRADAGRPVINNAYVYSLSLAVYATAWTFYGSVGRAASDGVGFLPIYIGPTLMIVLWWFVVRKMIRIAKLFETAFNCSEMYGRIPITAMTVTRPPRSALLP